MENETNTKKQSAPPTAGWLERVVGWRRQRIAARMAQDLAAEKAVYQLWAGSAEETCKSSTINGITLDIIARKAGRIARLETKLRQLSPSNGGDDRFSPAQPSVNKA